MKQILGGLTEQQLVQRVNIDGLTSLRELYLVLSTMPIQSLNQRRYKFS